MWPVFVLYIYIYIYTHTHTQKYGILVELPIIHVWGLNEKMVVFLLSVFNINWKQSHELGLKKKSLSSLVYRHT